MKVSDLLIKQFSSTLVSNFKSNDEFYNQGMEQVLTLFLKEVSANMKMEEIYRFIRFSDLKRLNEIIEKNHKELEAKALCYLSDNELTKNLKLFKTWSCQPFS